MRVILLNKVEHLGDSGDQMDVKAGYARNFLIPTGKAVPATKANQAFFKEQQIKLEAERDEKMAALNTHVIAIKEVGSITISAKTGHEGKIFGSIHDKHIIDKIKEKLKEDKKNADIDLTKSVIRIQKNQEIRTIGEHEVHIHLGYNISEKIIVRVIPEV